MQWVDVEGAIFQRMCVLFWRRPAIAFLTTAVSIRKTSGRLVEAFG